MQLLAEPIEDRISYLEGIIVQLKEENAAMAATQATLSDNQLIQLRLIHALKEKAKRSPGKTELSRAEKIERYLSSRPDHKATFETLKGYLQIDNVRLNEAITTLMSAHPGSYSIQKARTGDKRKKILILLPK